MAAAPVQRYWPGKAPEWYKPGEEVSDDEAPAEPGTSAPAPAVVLKRAEDPRLRRLAQACSHWRLFHNLACSFASLICGHVLSRSTNVAHAGENFLMLFSIGSLLVRLYKLCTRCVCPAEVR